MNSNFKFSDLFSAAGFHDLDTLYVAHHHSGNAMVFDHEFIHDDILLDTEFGSVKYIFHKLLDSKIDARVKTRVKEWLKILCANSLNCHEAAATYVSIKDKPPGKRAGSYARRGR